jgi:hypothetical protein
MTVSDFIIPAAISALYLVFIPALRCPFASAADRVVLKWRYLVKRILQTARVRVLDR